MKKVKIRRATAWDIVKVTRLLEGAAKEQREDIWYSRPSKNAAKKIYSVLNVIDKGYVVVAETQDRKQIVAAMGMSFATDDWSEDWVMQNEWTYVLKTWRDTDVASQLLMAVEMFADTAGNPATGKGLPIIIGMMTGRDTDLKDKLMERKGYQYGGGNFVRAPRDVQERENAKEGDPPVA